MLQTTNNTDKVITPSYAVTGIWCICSCGSHSLSLLNISVAKKMMPSV